MARQYQEGRICFCKDFYGEGEHFVFQTKWSDEDEWGLESAFPCCDIVNGELVTGSGDLLNYQALTTIREWLDIGVKFYFGAPITCERRSE